MQGSYRAGHSNPDGRKLTANSAGLPTPGGDLEQAEIVLLSCGLTLLPMGLHSRYQRARLPLWARLSRTASYEKAA